jgi:ABC-type multidrug transport system ATPase subunit
VQSRWAGRFTTTDSNGDTVVLTGSAGSNLAVVTCPETTYCPGLDDLTTCPDICPEGTYCPTPAESISCPKGKYCPYGAVEALDCRPLTVCAEEGLYIYRPFPITLIVIICAIAAYYGLVYAKRRMTKSARENREKYMASMPEEKDPTAPVTADKLSLTIDLEFEGLQLTLPNGGPTIMQGVSGAIKHGQITAVMGPSGAGKSTFLTILSGKVSRTGGSLRVNGKESELSHFRRIIGFVPQEDVMLRELTVEDVIRHSALMRLPSTWSRERKLAKADETIDALDLTRVRDSVIGDELRRGVSGGQRKRVNIGIEMVTEPSLLCLDEPTSGLDSTSSLSVLQALKALAVHGVNVIAVLHQPKYEIFELFDKVLLLGVGGRTVYLGPATGMGDYFGNRGFPCPPKLNPADFYMDVVAGIVPRKDHEKFDKNDLFEMWETAAENPSACPPEENLEAKNVEVSSSRRTTIANLAKKGPIISRVLRAIRWSKDIHIHVYRNTGKDADEIRTVPGFWGQFRHCFVRSFFQRVSDPTFTLTPLLMEALAGLLLGTANRGDTLYSGIPSALVDDANGGSAWIAQNLQVTDLLPSIWGNLSLGIVLVSVMGVDIFGQERANFFRETATGLKVSAYWLAKTLEVMMWLPLYSAVFSSISYGISPFLMSFVNFWLIIWMAHVGFYGLGMLVSLFCAPKNRGIISLVAGLVFSMAFTGVVFNYGDAGAKGIFWLFWTFWCGQAFSSAEYSQYSPPFDIEILNDVNTAYGAKYGYGYDLESSFGRNIAFAALTACSFHLVVLWCLKVADYKMQR